MWQPVNPVNLNSNWRLQHHQQPFVSLSCKTPISLFGNIYIVSFPVKGNLWKAIKFADYPCSFLRVCIVILREILYCIFGINVSTTINISLGLRVPQVGNRWPDMNLWANSIFVSSELNKNLTDNLKRYIVLFSFKKIFRGKDHQE